MIEGSDRSELPKYRDSFRFLVGSGRRDTGSEGGRSFSLSIFRCIVLNLLAGGKLRSFDASIAGVSAAQREREFCSEAGAIVSNLKS